MNLRGILLVEGMRLMRNLGTTFISCEIDKPCFYSAGTFRYDLWTWYPRTAGDEEKQYWQIRNEALRKDDIPRRKR